MKSIQISIFSLLFLSFSFIGFAQEKTEKFTVAGECGTCKKKIEGAAKKAGATMAKWNADTKELSVTYASTSSNTAKIQKAIADAGYDTPGYKATEAAYDKLDDCCKYERKTDATAASCKDKCTGDHACMKDGKCEKDQACCKDSGCDKMDCCKKS